jgi:hypothetical protein
MGTYVLAYVGGDYPEDDAAAEAEMERWGAWLTGLGSAVLDGGNPFGPSSSIAPDGTVSEGTATALTGYSILSAASLDEALGMAQGCPHLASGGTVEVYETFEMG